MSLNSDIVLIFSKFLYKNIVNDTNLNATNKI